MRYSGKVCIPVIYLQIIDTLLHLLLINTLMALKSVVLVELKGFYGQ